MISVFPSPPSCALNRPLTVTGAFLGTPAFSSPEQLRGDELTVRSDIYSVGVTLYYALTGHHPFEARDVVRMLATVLERPAESPAKWRPGLPVELCRAVLRCLEKDPERRFHSYDDLRQSLLPYASAAPSCLISQRLGPPAPFHPEPHNSDLPSLHQWSFYAR